jgi:hypothetical protein
MADGTLSHGAIQNWQIVKKTRTGSFCAKLLDLGKDDQFS